MEAIAAAEGPNKAVLQSVWNSSEVQLALSGDHYTVQRFLTTWGDDDQDDQAVSNERPTLRIVG